LPSETEILLFNIYELCEQLTAAGGTSAKARSLAWREGSGDELDELESYATELADRVEELSLQLERCIDENLDLRMRVQIVQGLKTLSSSHSTTAAPEEPHARETCKDPSCWRCKKEEKREIPMEIQHLEAPL